MRLAIYKIENSQNSKESSAITKTNRNFSRKFDQFDELNEEFEFQKVVGENQIFFIHFKLITHATLTLRELKNNFFSANRNYGISGSF